jgi:hypothetical protein
MLLFQSLQSCLIYGQSESYICGEIKFMSKVCDAYTLSESSKYSVIQKDGLNFVRLYFLNYTWYVNDPHNI